jgi:hypothetical protein
MACRGMVGWYMGDKLERIWRSRGISSISLRGMRKITENLSELLVSQSVLERYRYSNKLAGHNNELWGWDKMCFIFRYFINNISGGACGSVVGLRHYAISRKVAGLIPVEFIGFFSWRNPSSRTMALGSTQPLTEMSTRNIPGSKGRPANA